MKNAYFDLAGEALVPAAHAHGPWAEDMLHGRLLGGLAARAIENSFGAPGWRVSRLTVDLFRPAPLKPVTIVTSPVRQGRRVKVVDALMTCDGHEVGRATAVMLVTGEHPPGNIWRPDQHMWPDPESISVPETGSVADAEQAGWLFRTVDGGFSTAQQSRVWTNDTVPLVHGEVMSPIVVAAVSGDIACPLANSSDQGLHYINADYTMLLARYPVGNWIGIEVAQQLHADGISIASANLVDQHGPFATSSGSSLVRPPLQMDSPPPAQD